MATDLYRTIFERASDGMFVMDASLTVLQSNRAFAALIGLPLEHVIGRTASDFVHPVDLSTHPLETKRVLDGTSIVTLRRLRHADGTTFEAEAASSPLPDGNILCVVRDVRGRPIVDALRDSEARFRGAAENLNAGLVVTDRDGCVVYVNERMCGLTGYARHELLGRELAPLLFDQREQQRHAERLRRRQAGVREQYEVEHRRKDGSTFLAEVSASPLHGRDGGVSGTVGVVLDVTERHEWQRETAEREYRYRMLFEVMPMPAWVYDVETLRFLAVNPAAVAQYGYTERQFLDMTILDIRPPGDVDALVAAIRSRENGLSSYMRARGYRHLKADGTPLDVEVVSHAFDFDGRAARIVVVNDVTEQTRMRAREREVEAQLLQAQKMEAVGRLAGGVAHDFNNLLTVVLGAAQSIEADLPIDSPLRAEVADIRTAVERGSGLTRRLLAFGRKEARAPALIDVHEVMSGIERLITRVLGDAVVLTVRAQAASSHVYADASQLEQVLVNLAFNARDAMPRGGTLTVSTTTCTVDDGEAETLGVAPGSFFVIEVADDGVGMDETIRARAFEPFYTTKGPHLGTGLGLATVYGIVKESAGAVTLASTPGVGTQVRIYLPLGTAPEGAAQSSHTKDDGPSAAAVGMLHGSANGRVLLVEDEPRVRAHVRRVLERCGYSVIEAENGAEGERCFLAQRSAIDAIVTDVVMPVLGGVEMVARLRALAPTVPVVFVSGFTAEDRALPLDERTAFITKPYTIATLSAALRGVLAAATVAG